MIKKIKCGSIYWLILKPKFRKLINKISSEIEIQNFELQCKFVKYNYMFFILNKLHFELCSAIDHVVVINFSITCVIN